MSPAQLALSKARNGDQRGQLCRNAKGVIGVGHRENPCKTVNLPSDEWDGVTADRHQNRGWSATPIADLPLEGGEPITADRATTQETLLSLSRLFFEASQTPTVAHLREQFACHRRWPVLEETTLFESIIRPGMARGYLCLFRMGDAESMQPEQCFSRL